MALGGIRLGYLVNGIRMQLRWGRSHREAGEGQQEGGRKERGEKKKEKEKWKRVVGD